jgi:hypothetical protein
MAFYEKAVDLLQDRLSGQYRRSGRLDQTTRWVDPHWHRGLSYFQLGWRWIRHALAQGNHLFSGLRLQLGPDPEPVYASKK